jgi:hypothetical protein
MSTDRRFTTPDDIRRLVDEHLDSARTTATDPWPHLERAHLLSQPWWWPHNQVHAAMFAVALCTRDRREALGQLVRIVVAGPGSFAGRYPTGNTGRSTMGLTQTAPTPDDVAALLAGHRPSDR